MKYTDAQDNDDAAVIRGVWNGLLLSIVLWSIILAPCAVLWWLFAR